MEELWENHQNAEKNKLDTEFKFMDFYNVGLLSQYLKKIRGGGFAGENRGGHLERVRKRNWKY